MYIPEIIEVKEKLEQLKKDGIVDTWELPYENLLTRRSAAIFFFTPVDKDSEKGRVAVCNELEQYENFSYRPNDEKRLSQLDFRVTFSEEEKEKNEKVLSEAEVV